MFLVSSCSCLCPIQRSQVSSREWRCSWSSADRRCSNYIWVIDNFIAYWGATYIRELTVVFMRNHQPIRHCWWFCKICSKSSDIWSSPNFFMNNKIGMSDDYFKISDDLLQIIRHTNVLSDDPKKLFVNTYIISKLKALLSNGPLCHQINIKSGSKWPLACL